MGQLHLVLLESVLRERKQQNEQPLRMLSKERPYLRMMSRVKEKEREKGQLISILFPMRDVIPRVS